MFTQRPLHRRAAVVATSWERIERWLAINAPEAAASLLPGAVAEDIHRFERRMGVTLPTEVRESFQIHDGQQPYVMGVLAGQPLATLEQMEDTLTFNRDQVQEYEQSDASCGFDAECTSFPANAIRCEHWNGRWLAMGDWDGNCYGIDLDPGPNGVVGQVINFGRNERAKYVLAFSWAHFLEDIADELEAGNLIIGRDKRGEVVSFGRPGHDDQALFRFYQEWSAAKLPVELQTIAPAIKTPVFPGAQVVGAIADEAWTCVQSFVRAMHAYEIGWLQVRPIHKLGYSLIVESEYGFRAHGLDMARRPVEWAPPAPREKMQLHAYNRQAVEEYRALLKAHCTERRRALDGSFVQIYPPHYDPAFDRIAQVRAIDEKRLLVYLQPVDGETTRYHLQKAAGRWLIDYKDVTTDHVTFVKQSLLFGQLG
ncbi:SMI1/KNR4 family protein [Anatilimnocola sp. NA78]|uniref:SMI1/KNR4 family protein n=1 Tax=Anatilimnocola sp. NA78 TaxID=3415683 RepID=UPI003CE474A7